MLFRSGAFSNLFTFYGRIIAGFVVVNKFVNMKKVVCRLAGTKASRINGPTDRPTDRPTDGYNLLDRKSVV